MARVSRPKQPDPNNFPDDPTGCDRWVVGDPIEGELPTDNGVVVSHQKNEIVVELENGTLHSSQQTMQLLGFRKKDKWTKFVTLAQGVNYEN